MNQFSMASNAPSNTKPNELEEIQGTLFKVVFKVERMRKKEWKRKGEFMKADTIPKQSPYL